MAAPTSPAAERGRPGIANVRRGFFGGLELGGGWAAFLGREAAAMARELEVEVDAAAAGGDGERGWGFGWERDCSPMDGGRGGEVAS